MVENNVALYLDFENLAISADETYPSKEKPLTIEPIVDFAANKGNICIKKSYADWSRNIFKQYQKYLLEYGFEMVYLPATSFQGKNGSDVRMAIDIMENMELFKTIDTFVIGSGDTDFISLTQRMLARGKKVIILGFDNSVGKLVKNNCTEFKSLDELLSHPDNEQESENASEKNGNNFQLAKSEKSDISKESTFQIGNNASIDINKAYGRDLIIRYIKTRSTEEPVSMSQLKMDLLRLQPSFSEKKLGYSSFKKYVMSMVGDVVDKVSTKKANPIVFLKEYQEIEVTKLDRGEEVDKYLRSAFRFQKSSTIRSELCKTLFKYFEINESGCLSEAIDYLFKNSTNLSKALIRKFIHTLAGARVFIYSEKEQQGPLLSRQQRLNDTISSPEAMEKAYLNYIKEKLSDQFPDIEDDAISSFLS